VTTPTTDGRIPEQKIHAEAMKLARQRGIDRPYTEVSATATYTHALIQAAFQAGYDYHRRTCDITKPRGWTAEEIGEMLIDRGEGAGDR